MAGEDILASIWGKASTGCFNRSRLIRSDIQNTEPGAPEQPGYWLWKIPRPPQAFWWPAGRQAGENSPPLPPTHTKKTKTQQLHLMKQPPQFFFLLNNQKPKG